VKTGRVLVLLDDYGPIVDCHHPKIMSSHEAPSGSGFSWWATHTEVKLRYRVEPYAKVPFQCGIPARDYWYQVVGRIIA
jgi:hypothetical protein